MKKLLCVAVGILSTTLLMSCGNKQGKSDEFKPSLDTKTDCEIKVVGSYDNFEALEAEFVRFNSYYPNVKLSYEKVEGYNDNIANVLDGDNKPNIFFSLASWMTGEEKYNSIISHMEDLSDKSLKINIDVIRPGLINRDAQGKVLLVPIFSRTYGTLVNNDLFTKEGVNVPTTWTELLSVCETLANKGYKSPMMGYTLKDSSCLMNTVAYPAFVASLAKNPDAITLGNNLDPSIGEYMREALQKVKQLVDDGAVDIDECDEIKDNYSKVLLRFFEGDVPMMICAGDTVSGRKKREDQSEAYQKSPFNYSYVPIPLTDQGGYFIDSPSIEFSVNKNCENLDMTHEFMRFLITKEELKTIASGKGLINSTKDAPFDAIYSSFSQIATERTFSPEILGIKDPLAKQIRIASLKVGRGDLTIDEAVAQFGQF